MATDMRKIGILLVIASVIGVGAASYRTDGRNLPPRETAAWQERLPETPTETIIHGEENMFGSTKNVNTVEHASDADFQQKVLDASEPVLVDFYADWCGPCRMIAPVLEELARELPTARIVKVNVDHSPNLASQYGIDSIPALMVFQQGKIAKRHVGLANKAQLRSMLGM